MIVPTTAPTALRPSATPAGRRAVRSRRRPPLVIATLALLVAAVSLTPVGYLLLREGFSLHLLRHELAAPVVLPELAHTVELAAGVSVASVLLGVGLAVLVVRTNLPLRRLWTVLFVLPLAIPGFVSSYTWVAASLRFAPQSRAIFGYGGAVLILTLTVYPYVFLPVIAALRGLDPAQEEAARSLGYGTVRTFARVTLPQLRPAIAGGGLIIALHMFAEYGTLQLLNYPTLTTAIMQRATSFGDPTSARALSVVLAAGSLFVLALDRLLRGRPRSLRVGAGVARPPVPWRLGRATPAWLAACLAVVVFALGIPGYVTLTGLLRAYHPEGPGVAWLALAHTTWTTTRLGLAAAIAATVVALPVSVLAARRPGPLATVAERGVWVAHSLPGVILALALVYLGVHWLDPIYLTTTMLVAAYVILFLPLAVANQQVGMARASRHFDDIARSLGHGRISTALRVSFPLAFPGLAVGALFVLIEVEKELTTTLLLHPTGIDTLSTQLWATTNGDVLDFTAAAPYGLAIMLIAAVPTTLLARRALAAVRPAGPSPARRAAPTTSGLA